MPGTGDFKAPLYHAAGRFSFVGRPRPLLSVAGLHGAHERCGVGTCERPAAFAANAVLDEERRGEVRICTFHAQPLLEA